MKRLIVTTADDKFAPGTALLLYSLKRNMVRFAETDVKVLYTNLSDENKKMIKSVLSRVQFEKPDMDFCAGIKTLYGADNQDTYLCLEAFRQHEYDQVICLDSDMLCIGDISPLLGYDKVIMACIGKRNLNTKEQTYHHGIDKFNAGFMVIGKQILQNNRVYQDLTSIVRHIRDNKRDGLYNVFGDNRKVFNDQDVIRVYFSSAPTHILPDWYNFKNFCLGPNFEETNKIFDTHQNDVKILHFSGKRKPWANKTDRSGGPVDGKIAGIYDVCSVADPEEMNNSAACHIWHDYYEECFGEKCINDWYRHDRS